MNLMERVAKCDVNRILAVACIALLLTGSAATWSVASLFSSPKPAPAEKRNEDPKVVLKELQEKQALLERLEGCEQSPEFNAEIVALSRWAKDLDARAYSSTGTFFRVVRGGTDIPDYAGYSYPNGTLLIEFLHKIQMGDKTAPSINKALWMLEHMSGLIKDEEHGIPYRPRPYPCSEWGGSYRPNRQIKLWRPGTLKCQALPTSKQLLIKPRNPVPAILKGPSGPRLGGQRLT